MGLDNPTHWIFIIVLLLLIFGARRLPEIGRSLGIGLREFKQSVTGESSQPALTTSTEQTESQAQAPAEPAEPAR
jgi:sec-independent protein translocase protein TatA